MPPSVPRRSLLPFVIVNSLVIVAVIAVMFLATASYRHNQEKATALSTCRARIVVGSQQDFNRALAGLFAAALRQDTAGVQRESGVLDSQPDVLKRIDEEC